MEKNLFASVNDQVMKEFAEKGQAPAPAQAPAPQSQQAAPSATQQQAPAPTATPTFDKATVTNEQLLELLKERNIALPKEADLPQETEAQKKQREELEDAMSIEFGIRNGKSKDELLKYKTLEGKDDIEIVYGDFKEKYLKQYPKASEQTIKQRFNAQFNVVEKDTADMNEDELAQYNEDKAYGETLIKSRAERLREKAMQPYNETKEAFKGYMQKEATYQEIAKVTGESIDKLNGALVLDLNGEKINFNIPAKDLPDIRNRVIDTAIKMHDIGAGQQFDVMKAIESVVKTNYLNEISSVYANVVKDNAVKEALRPFENFIPPRQMQGSVTPDMEAKIRESANTMFTKRNGKR